MNYSAPAVVYRMSDREGRVLYIGCTTNLPKRLLAHRCTKQWFKDVWQLDTEPFPTLSDAGCAERDAIAAHQPPYNHQHTAKARAPRPATRGKRPFPSSRYEMVGLVLAKFHDIDLTEWLRARAAVDSRQVANELRAIDDVITISPPTIRSWIAELERVAS